MEGKRLAHYEILDKLGEGGMGVVWRARDTTLDREVAIKVLPEPVARDTERLARFEREAKLLASLNHPGIAAIHGLHEEADGTRFLAMELVPGEDLAQRLDRGPLPLDEALFVAIQIAEALEAAHAQDVVHRDLKPANVILTPEGKAKVLDFGLAKPAEPDASSSPSLSMSPTVTSLGTVPGVILGTAAYMSPEQARGKALDRRTDIWSFGCVLFEMLSAHRLFGGESVSDSLGAILHKEPDWSKLPPGTPPMVRWLLRRCLTRNPQKRLHDIADARVELQHALEDPHARALGLVAVAGGAAAAPSSRPWLLPLIAAATLVVGLAAGWAFFKEDPAPLPLRKLDLGVVLDPEASDPPDVALSPDGKHAAFTHEGGLWVQTLDAVEPRRLPGTDGAQEPFWSPDGQQIGFFVDSKLWKVPLAGGAVALGELGSPASPGTGGTWSPDGTIYAGLGSTGILQMSSLGGEPKMAIPTADDEGDLHQPHVLPDARGILFVSHPESSSPGVLNVWSDGERRKLLTLDGQTIWNPCYAPSGHILFERIGGGATEGLWALPFSLRTLEADGEPFLVVPDAGRPSVSTEGSLLYVHRPSLGGLSQLTWVDAGDHSQEPIGDKRSSSIWNASVSPDGGRVAFSSTDNETGGGQIWIRDLDRGTETRLTGSSSFKFNLNWDRAGERIVYGEFFPSEQRVSVSVVPADGSGPARTFGETVVLFSIAPDGEHALVGRLPEGEEMGPNAQFDIWRIPLDGSGEGEPVLQSPEAIQGAVTSPDGAWMVYAVQTASRTTLYLTRYPDVGRRWTVAAGEVGAPLWAPNGDRIYYTDGTMLHYVEVGLSGGTPRLGPAQPMFNVPPNRANQSTPDLNISPDGTRFVVVAPAAEQREGSEKRRSSIKFVQNWFAEFGVRSNP